MNPKFSAGGPRPGQWVLLELSGEQRIGIHNPPGSGDPKDLRDFLAAHPDQVRIDLVGPDGIRTVQTLVVNVATLEPLLDKNLIPEPRRRTMDASFVPRP